MADPPVADPDAARVAGSTDPGAGDAGTVGTPGPLGRGAPEDGGGPGTVWRSATARLRSVPPSLVVGLGVLFVVDAWWLDRFRTGYPVAIDEAGYMTMGMVDASGLRTGGPAGLWHAVLGSKLQAPLGPALTVPFHLLFGASLADGYALSLVLMVVLGILTYTLARSLMSQRWSVLAALTVAASPGVTANAREFYLALPLAVMFTASVWALVRSGGLTRTGWAVASGVFLGLATVSRTMGLAFVAGPVAAAVLQAGILRPARRRVLGAALLVVVGTAVAAVWYRGSFSTVWPYLHGQGRFFTVAPTHGTGGSGGARRPLWEVALHDLVLQDLFVPLFLGLLVCFAVGAVALLDRRRHQGSGPGPAGEHPRMAWVRRQVGAPGFVPAVCLLEGWAALSVSGQSVWQWVPLLPVLVVCATASVARVRWTGVRWAVGGYLALLIVLNTVMGSDTVGWLTRPVSVTVPLLGSSYVVDGETEVRTLLRKEGSPVGSPTAPLPAVDRGWLDTSREVADLILAEADRRGVVPVVAFASRDRLFNTNTVQLEAEIGAGRDIPTGQLLATLPGDTVAAYRAQLTEPQYGEPNVLVTVDASADEYQPQVTQAKAEQAATSVGFVPVDDFTLPDGRHGRIWWLDR